MRFLALTFLFSAITSQALAAVTAGYPALTSKIVALAADDQVVTIEDYGMIYLTSDDATAANRTFTLSGCNQGQILVLVWNDADEGQLVDTGTVYLSANWEPTNIGTTLTLVCSGSIFYEIGRSVS